MHEDVPQTRAASIVWHLLLRHWSRQPGISSAQAARLIGLTWEGAYLMLRALESHPALPIFQVRGKLWVANYRPFDYDPVPKDETTKTQRAGLAAHRIISRALLCKEVAFRRGIISRFLSITPDSTSHMLSKLGDRNGIPIYPMAGLWHLDLCQFLEHTRPDKSHIPKASFDTLPGIKTQGGMYE